MNADSKAVAPQEGYLGLTRAEAGLPAHWYFDPAHHDLEMKRVWHRNWVYACRSSELADLRSWRRFDFVGQSVVVLRDESSTLRAFHNTCRHRGSTLCTGPSGRFPQAGIVCPYHAWRYDLAGQLRKTSSQFEPEGFNRRDWSLYPVALREWNGLVFVCLAPDPPPFGQMFDAPADRLDAWEMAGLATGHTFTKTIRCNWKVFWENYNECLHCPGVHPELCKLVPVYGRGLQDIHEDPRWRDHAASDDPRFRGGLRQGARSWSATGQVHGLPFPKLTDADRDAGHVYVTFLPSMFVAAHIDYVRVVRLLPLGPELTELRAEYLFRPETLADPARDLQPIYEITQQVMAEDGAACELNQQGLHATPHAAGVLMPEEYLLRDLHAWLRAQL
jgi:Rieske 2Fe-2S family protein